MKTNLSSLIYISYDLKLKKKDNKQVIKVCWEWKWDVFWNALNFEEHDRLWYFSKVSSRLNETWIIVCDEKNYVKFAIWEKEEKNKRRKTCVKVQHEKKK
jgi:hypothetical protein